MIKDNYIKQILIIGILIRLLIMPFFYHPDIKTYNFQASFLRKQVFNIYDYLAEKKSELPFKEEFVYFPLTYYVLGTYQFLISPILGPDFDKWLFNASAENVSDIGVYKYLFFLKLPYLFLDLLIGFLLMKFFVDLQNKKKIFTIWLLNPFSVYLIYVFSNVDIFVVLTTVLSLLFVKRNQYIWGALLLGIGAGFKAYPLLLLPLLIFNCKLLKDKILSILVCFGVFALIIGPFLNSKAFQSAALVSGLTTRLFIPQINLGFSEMILIPVLLLGVYYSYYFLKEKKNYEDLNIGILSIFLIVFSFIHFHIQWLLWVMPFIVMSFLNNKSSGIFIVLGLLGLAIPMLYNDKYMSVSLLNVVSSNVSLLPSLHSIAQRIYDPVILASILHSLFAAVSISIIFLIHNKKNET